MKSGIYSPTEKKFRCSGQMNGFRSLGKEKPQIPHPKIVRALENPSITINEPCRVWLLAMLYAILNLDWITIRQKMKISASLFQYKLGNLARWKRLFNVSRVFRGSFCLKNIFLCSKLKILINSFGEGDGMKV